MPVSLPEPLMPLEDWRFARLTADEYQAMTESGVLREAPLELLDGMLVWKDRRDRGGSIMNVGVRHGNCVGGLHRLLDDRCTGHGCHARAQQPLRVSMRDVPEPDVMILKGVPRDYHGRQAQAPDAIVVIEVADSSLKQDREDKLRKYAGAGIAEYWIVNLIVDQLEIYTTPDTGAQAYLAQKILEPDEVATVRLADGTDVAVDVTEILSF